MGAARFKARLAPGASFPPPPPGTTRPEAAPPFWMRPSLPRREEAPQRSLGRSPGLKAAPLPEVPVPAPINSEQLKTARLPSALPPSPRLRALCPAAQRGFFRQSLQLVTGLTHFLGWCGTSGFKRGQRAGLLSPRKSSPFEPRVLQLGRQPPGLRPEQANS